MGFVLSAIENDVEVFLSIDPVVEITFQTYLIVVLQFFYGVSSLTFRTFMPKSIRRLFLLVRRSLYPFLYSSKPGGHNL